MSTPRFSIDAIKTGLTRFLDSFAARRDLHKPHSRRRRADRTRDVSSARWHHLHLWCVHFLLSPLFSSLINDSSFTGATDDEPLPSHPSLAVASDQHLNTLHREITTLSPHLANAEEVVRQACYLPVSERGRPYVGKVKGVEGVWVGGGLTCWGITLGQSFLLRGSKTLAESSFVAHHRAWNREMPRRRSPLFERSHHRRQRLQARSLSSPLLFTLV